MFPVSRKLHTQHFLKMSYRVTQFLVQNESTLSTGYIKHYTKVKNWKFLIRITAMSSELVECLPSDLKGKTI